MAASRRINSASDTYGTLCGQRQEQRRQTRCSRHWDGTESRFWDLEPSLAIVQEVACRAVPKIGDEQQLRRRLRPAEIEPALTNEMAG